MLVELIYVIVIFFTLGFELRHLLFLELALIKKVTIVVWVLVIKADNRISAIHIEVIDSLDDVGFGLDHQATIALAINLLLT